MNGEMKAVDDPWRELRGIHQSIGSKMFWIEILKENGNQFG